MDPRVAVGCGDLFRTLFAASLFPPSPYSLSMRVIAVAGDVIVHVSLSRVVVVGLHRKNGFMRPSEDSKSDAKWLTGHFVMPLIWSL